MSDKKQFYPEQNEFTSGWLDVANGIGNFKRKMLEGGFQITVGGRQVGRTRKRIIEQFAFSEEQIDNAFDRCGDWNKVIDCLNAASTEAIDLNDVLNREGFYKIKP